MAMAAVHSSQVREAVERAEQAIKHPPRKNEVREGIELFIFLESFALSNWSTLPIEDKNALKALAYMEFEKPKIGFWREVKFRFKFAYLIFSGQISQRDIAEFRFAANSFSETVLSIVEQENSKYNRMVTERVSKALEAGDNDLVSLEELRERILAD